MPKYTINDVAKQAGVSKATVSRYLNGHFERMSETTKARLKTVIADLHYVPNHNASALKSKRTHQIGVVVGDLANGYAPYLVKGIAAITQPAGVQILVAEGKTVAQEHEVLLNLLSQNVDGIILQPRSPKASDYQFLQDANVSVMLVDRLVDPLVFACVTSNDRQATHILAQAVLEKGYQQALVIANPLAEATVRQERFDAWQTVGKNLNIPVTLLEVDSDEVDDLQTWLTRVHDQKAVIFAANGNLMLATLKWLQHHHIAIPGTVGLCGYDDWRFGGLAAPALTVVNQDLHQIGKTVAAQLMALIAGETIEICRTEIPADIHMRQSV
nr:LacI family DNA-binding transcriptional regulator [Lacticaseibacillus porcinae]